MQFEPNHHYSTAQMIQEDLNVKSPICVQIGARAARMLDLQQVGDSLTNFGCFVVLIYALVQLPIGGQAKDIAFFVGVSLAVWSLLAGWPWNGVRASMMKASPVTQAVVLMLLLAALSTVAGTACAMAHTCSEDGGILVGMLAIPAIGALLMLLAVRSLDRSCRHGTGKPLRFFFHAVNLPCKNASPPEADAQIGLSSPSPRRPFVSVMIILALTVFALSLSLGYDKIFMEQAFGIYLAAIVQVTAIVTLLAAMFISVRTAYAFFRPDASSLTGSNTSLALLIRSFAEEDTSLRTFLGRRRLEEVIDDCISDSTHLVAIGDPKEIVPKLGAVRTYASDTTWQSIFFDLIRDSRVVFALAGTSHWLEWELRAIAEAKALPKLLIAFPDMKPSVKKAIYQLIRRAIVSLTFLGEQESEDLVFLGFRSDRQPIVVACSHRSAAVHSFALRLAMYCATASEVPTAIHVR